MNIKDQVTSLEISKRLKELGVKQDGLYSWQRSWHDKPYILNQGGTFETEDTDALFSAFTVAELGELIKGHEWDKELRGWPTVTVGGNWRVDLDDEGMLCSVQKEADARGKILIYLLENNLISL